MRTFCLSFSKFSHRLQLFEQDSLLWRKCLIRLCEWTPGAASVKHIFPFLIRNSSEISIFHGKWNGRVRSGANITEITHCTALVAICKNVSPLSCAAGEGTDLTKNIGENKKIWKSQLQQIISIISSTKLVGTRGNLEMLHHHSTKCDVFENLLSFPGFYFPAQCVKWMCNLCKCSLNPPPTNPHIVFCVCSRPTAETFHINNLRTDNQTFHLRSQLLTL